MSFNLNRLVQPECGGPNPLVTAARQISMNPTSVRHRPPPTTLINFSKEFQDQQELTGGIRNMNLSRGVNHQFPCASTSSSTIQQPSWKTPYAMGHHHLFPSPQLVGSNLQTSLAEPATSAGDQLETKYRNDMISNQNHSDEGRLDDMAFWQNLSQKYIGPNTYDNAAKISTKNQIGTTSKSERSVQEEKSKLKQQESEGMKASEPTEDFQDLKYTTQRPNLHEMEYIFDERNPLKDQFEDPFAEGLKKLEQGDIPSAALLFEAAVQKEPDNETAWRYLGTTQAQNEKDMSAIRALKNCLKLTNNEDQQALLAVSVSLANESYHYEACKHLLEWLINHQNYKSVGANLAEFQRLDELLSDDPFYINNISDKHYSYVRDKFVEAARLSPNNPDPEVQCALGVLFNIRGDYEKAVDCFKAALSVKSNDSLLWNRLGATLANGNKSDEAVIAYRKALEISPGFLRSRYNLAISLIHLNTYEEAAKQLVQILNMQAAGRGSKNTQIRTRAITSTAIWNTLRTVATLLNKPDWYPLIDGRDLVRCNQKIFNSNIAGGPSSGASANEQN